MAFDSALPHVLPWNYPWIKDEIERRDEYIAQLEAELAHQKPQNDAHGAIDGESVKVPAESETEAHSEPDSREKLEADMAAWLNDNLCTDCYDADIAYGWLDRQAAITEREFMEIREDLTADNLWMHERITELQQRVDELTAERDEWKAKAEENSREKPKRKMLRIEQVLKERGMSQAKAARMSDVNESSMSRIVRGMEPPFPKRGQRIADVLGWEGDWRELFEEVDADEIRRLS